MVLFEQSWTVIRIGKKDIWLWGNYLLLIQEQINLLFTLLQHNYVAFLNIMMTPLTVPAYLPTYKSQKSGTLSQNLVHVWLPGNRKITKVEVWDTFTDDD